MQCFDEYIIRADILATCTETDLMNPQLQHSKSLYSEDIRTVWLVNQI